SDEDEHAGQLQTPNLLFRSVTPAEHQSGYDENGDRQAGENVRLRVVDDIQPAPDEEIAGRLEQAADIGAEGDDFVQTAPQPIGVLEMPIPVEHWNQRNRREAPGNSEFGERAPLPRPLQKKWQPQSDE